MPRRRNKRTSLEQPRLQFIESPSNQSPPRLSPDFCAINPITARKIPVNDIPDLSWVTPQFGDKNHYYQQGNGNKTTRRTTRLRGNKVSDIKHLDQKSFDTGSKYKPLSFITSSDSNSRQSGDRYICKRSDVHRFDIPHGEKSGTVMDENHHTAPVAAGSDSYTESFQILTPVLNVENNLHQENSNSESAMPSLIELRKPKNNGVEQFSGNEDQHWDNQSVENKDDCHELSAVFGKVQRTKPLFLDVSSTPPPSPTPRVLAVDTPECDYDLTMRQRQIKYFLRNRRR